MQADPVKTHEKRKSGPMVQGVPLRLALGAKDMEKGTIEVARRDMPGVKEFVPWEELTQHVADKLDQIQVCGS